MAIDNIEKELAKIYEDLDKKKLVLPNFQRGFVWDKSKQKQLLASTLVDLPIGSLLLLEGEANDFAKRELCFPDSFESETDCEYVLDGQQRLSTLRTVFYDIFSSPEDDWKVVFDGMFGALRNRWFLRVKPEEGEDDLFGYETLEFRPFSRLTDSDISDFLEVKPIKKTKTHEAHHPGFSPKNSSGVVVEGKAQRRNALAQIFSESYLVPLYEIYEGDAGLHRKVLQKIADRRVDELKAIAQDEGHSLEIYRSIFHPISTSLSVEDIEEALKPGEGASSSEFFADSWAQLKSQWVERFSIALEAVLDRKQPIIFLHRSEIHRAVAIFEAINRGGEPLTVYDLVVAKSAHNSGAENLSSVIISAIEKSLDISDSLNSRFASIYGGDRQWFPKYMDVISGNEPSKMVKECFVNVLSLLSYVKLRGETCRVEYIKREKILSIPSKDINDLTVRVINSVIRALAFIQHRCGVVQAKSLQYKLMLVVLAYFLEDDNVWESKEKLDKLEYWYWVSLLGGGYSYRQNEQCIEDIRDIGLFLGGGDNPFLPQQKNIFKYQDFLTKELLLRNDEGGGREQSSARNGLLQFLLGQCGYDFDLSGAKRRLYAWEVADGRQDVELHHIVPLANVTEVGQTSSELRGNEDHILNSSLNLIYISKEANRSIRAASPADYLSKLDDMAFVTSMVPGIEKYQKAFTEKDYFPILEARFDYLSRDVLKHLDSLLDKS